MGKFLGSSGVTRLWNKIMAAVKITTSSNVTKISIFDNDVTPVLSATTTGSGNAVTGVSTNGNVITLTKGATYLKAADISGKADASNVYTKTEADGLFASKTSQGITSVSKTYPVGSRTISVDTSTGKASEDFVVAGAVGNDFGEPSAGTMIPTVAGVENYVSGEISNMADKSVQKIEDDTAHSASYDKTQGKKITIATAGGTSNVDVVTHDMVVGAIGSDGIAKIPTAAAVDKFISDKGYTTNTGTVTSVTIKGTSPISVSSSSAITSSGERTISHGKSGVTAGTYRSVTVDDMGHVTAGTNPTTLSEYGITDATITSPNSYQSTVKLGSTEASLVKAGAVTNTAPGGSSNDFAVPSWTGVNSAIQNAITDVAGALVYKGTVSAQSELVNKALSKGWYYIVTMPNTTTTSVTIGGNVCEAGDMVIVKTAGTYTATTLGSAIDVIQSNIEEMTEADVDAAIAAASAS